MVENDDLKIENDELNKKLKEITSEFLSFKRATKKTKTELTAANRKIETRDKKINRLEGRDENVPVWWRRTKTHVIGGIVTIVGICAAVVLKTGDSPSENGDAEEV